MTEDPFITPQDIENLIKRDPRWAVIDIAIKVDEELRDSVAMNLILEAAKRNYDQAKDELINHFPEINPADTQAIIGLQAKMQCAKLIANTLTIIRQQGLAAQASLEEDGKVELHNEYNDTRE